MAFPRGGVALAEPWFRLAVTALRPPLAVWWNWRMEGLENVPPEGPILVAANHTSNFDPLAVGLFLLRADRRPRFFAKAELYKSFFLRRLFTGAKQIKVERGSGDAGPVEAAKRAISAGECVVIFPEATLTKNPDFSPMKGKTGVARIALETGVPVLPVATWGAHRVFPRKGEKNSLAFGRPIMVKAGKSLDLSRYADQRAEPEVLRAATDEVMGEISSLAADLRARYPKRWA